MIIHINDTMEYRMILEKKRSMYYHDMMLYSVSLVERESGRDILIASSNNFRSSEQAYMAAFELLAEHLRRRILFEEIHEGANNDE